MWTVNETWGAPSAGGATPGAEGWRWLPAVDVVMGVLAGVTVVGNALLLLAILCHEQARSRSFHMHIVNMTVVALVQGAGVLPLWTHYLIRGTWQHGDPVCRWWLATDTMTTSVAALTIVVTACDRFIYLTCYRFVKEGGKYITCCILMALSWLLALGLTLTLTLMDGGDSQGGAGDAYDLGSASRGWRSGVQPGDQCNWGEGRGRRVVGARLMMYGVGAGLGAGLCLALLTLPCLGMGHVMPVDDADDEVLDRTTRRSNSHEAQPARPLRRLDSRGHAEGDTDEEDFPTFALIKKTDRLEERERWKWQVISLLVVALAWALLWFPSHLIALADVLGLEWRVPHGAVVGSVIAGYLHAALQPIIWLLHRPVRGAVADLIFCRCCRQGEDEEDDGDSVDLQDMGPYRRPEVTG